MKKENIYQRYKTKRRFIVGMCIIILFFLYMFKNSSFLVRALSAIGFLVVFYLIDHFFDLDFKHYHYGFIVIIAISSFLLSPLYYVYPQYDKIQHFVQPIMFASIVFHMISQLDLKLKWKIVFTFFVVIGCLGIFELGEFLLDYLYDLKLQGVYLRDVQGLEKYNILMDRNDDTMVDMSLGVLGSLVYSFSVYFYLRRKK